MCTAATGSTPRSRRPAAADPGGGPSNRSCAETHARLGSGPVAPVASPNDVRSSAPMACAIDTSIWLLSRRLAAVVEQPARADPAAGAAGEDVRHHHEVVLRRLADLGRPQHDAVVEQAALAFLVRVELGQEVGELLRVPGLDLVVGVVVGCRSTEKSCEMPWWLPLMSRN